MKMQKIGIIVLLMFLLFSMIGSCLAVDMAPQTSYFRAEGITDLSQNTEVSMIANTVTIDIEKEKVTNQFILQNTTNVAKSHTFSIPLGNTQTGTTVENVEIKINNTQVQPKIEERDGKVYYIIATKMAAGEYKKIQIEYNSTNMSTAPRVEYELENFGIEKTCKNLQVKIIVPEKDVPLVTKVEPANYTFEDDTITYSYQNVNIIDLNRRFVIEKEIYEDEIVLEKQVNGEFERTKVFGLSREEFLQKVKELVDANFHTWIRDGISLNIQNTTTTSQIIDNLLNDNKISSTYTYLDGTGTEQAAKYEVGETYTKLFNYVILRQWIKENRQDLIAQYFHNAQENENGILDVFEGQVLSLEYVRQNCELEGLTLKENSTINQENGWTNPSRDGKTIVTTKLANTLINKFNETTLDYKDVQVECVVSASYNEMAQYFKNVAEITKHSDSNGNESVTDRDSTPNNLTDEQKQNYRPGTSEQGWGYEDDDDYEELIIPGKIFDLALRKFIVSVNGTPVEPSREPQVDVTALANGTVSTAIKQHTKTPIQVENGDTVVYTIRVYNEGNVDGYAKEITDILPEGLILASNSTINTENGWTNPSGDGRTIVTTKLTDTLIEKFNGTSLDYADVQVECVVSLDNIQTEHHLKNIAEITVHSDDTGNESIPDRDSTPDNLTEDQKENYNPGSSEQGWGYEDDDDYEELVIPGKEFDLALRKFITSINGKELVDTDGNYLRAPTVDVTPLVDGSGTTANYRHPKDPVGVSVGDIVIYTLRIYNEGELDGYASSITDYLPPQLEFVMDDEENFNSTQGWLIDSSLRKATTTKLAKSEIDPEENLIKAFDPDTMTEPDYVDIQIKCRVKSTADLDRVITNIAEITDFTDENGNTVTDRDSEKANVNLPSDENLPDYKGNDSNKSILDDENYFYKGQEDDDDFEKLILEEFDLALRKFITGVDENPVTNRVPVFTNVKDENGNYIYEHTKDPVEVETMDVVEYTIRVYNEGNIAGYAKEITDDIPTGLEFLPDHETNIEYRWVMVDENGNETDNPEEAVAIRTDYLSKEQEETPGENLLEGFDPDTMTSPDYKEVKVAFRVVAANSYEGIITNIAEITDDSDEDGNEVEDKDSTPDNGDETEDDIDKEHIKLKYFDLALRKFITKVDNTEVTNRVPVFTIDENGNYVYEHTKEPVEVANGNIVTYTLRIYNEGTQAGYASLVKDDLPEGLLFLPEHETNVEYRWVMLDENGNVTENVEEAVVVQTDYLSKEQEDQTGRDNLLDAFDRETMQEPDHRDIQIAFQVTEPNTSDRILINQAQIADDQNEKGEDVVDKDSTPDEWIEGEDDQDIEKVKVKYFDLALRKWVTQAIVIENGKETVTDTGHKAEDDPEAPVKVEIPSGKLNKVVVKFRYKIRVTNEGEIAGYVKEITDYVPEGLQFVAADNPGWTEKNGVITTDALKDTLLQPGESAEVEIVLTWINNANNMGLKVNTAEISEDDNEYDTPDIDSTPNNKVPGEDDIDDAPVILSIKTGVAGIKAEYIGLIGGSIIILAAGVIFIKKFVL